MLEPMISTLSAFFMNREYHVDMILWRYLYGAVTNAAYIKPFLSYEITKQVKFKAGAGLKASVN